MSWHASDIWKPTTEGTFQCSQTTAVKSSSFPKCLGNILITIFQLQAPHVFNISLVFPQFQKEPALGQFLLVLGLIWGEDLIPSPHPGVLPGAHPGTSPVHGTNWGWFWERIFHLDASNSSNSYQNHVKDTAALIRFNPMLLTPQWGHWAGAQSEPASPKHN